MSMDVAGTDAPDRATPLRGLLDEVGWREAEQQQNAANNGRCAENLHDLLLALEIADHVQQRSGTDEVDALYIAHVDRDDAALLREFGELRYVCGIRAQNR